MSEELEYPTITVDCWECDSKGAFVGETSPTCDNCNGAGTVELPDSDEHCEECECELSEAELNYFDGLCRDCFQQQNDGEFE